MNKVATENPISAFVADKMRNVMVNAAVTNEESNCLRTVSHDAVPMEVDEQSNHSVK
jgi:hypothetical protein